MRIARPLLPFALLVLLALLHSCRTLSPHVDLLVGNRSPEPNATISITYLGCNGFLIRSASETLLVDPCFTRPSLLKVALNRRIPSNAERVGDAISRADMPDRVDAILVTHAHYDHMLDVPAVQRQLGGTILASPTGCHIAIADGGGPKPGAVDPVLPGARREIGRATIHVLEAAHDRICGRVPFEGRLTRIPVRAPTRASDYVCGQPLAFLIEIGGKTIYIDSGGRPEILPRRIEGGVDLAILGAALPDSRRRFLPAVERLQPRFVYPGHQDNFFRSLDKPYRFNLGTNFPALKREFEVAETGATLILFDFFQTLQL